MGIGLEWYKKQRYNAGFKAGIEEGRRMEREAQQRKRRANNNADAKNGNEDAK